MCSDGASVLGSSKEATARSMVSAPVRCQTRAEPHSAQKPRSATVDERRIRGRASRKSTLDLGYVAQAIIGAPEAFWHIRQWQKLTWEGEPPARKRTAPQRQPPS